MIDKAEIVLAEDNPTDAEFITRALKQQGLHERLAHFQDGEDVLEYIFAEGKFEHRNIADVPKVIFLDIKMPKVSGLEVLHRIKLDTRTKSIPVVILTSSQQQVDVVKSYQLGANSYIVKPIEFDDFVKTVSDLANYWMTMNRGINS